MRNVQAQHEPEKIRVDKYKGTRYWAIWLGDRLLAVTVYKKGAMAVKQALDRQCD